MSSITLNTALSRQIAGNTGYTFKASLKPMFVPDSQVWLRGQLLGGYCYSQVPYLQ